jgi:hypothetical protein
LGIEELGSNFPLSFQFYEEASVSRSADPDFVRILSCPNRKMDPAFQWQKPERVDSQDLSS